MKCAYPPHAESRVMPAYPDSRRTLWGRLRVDHPVRAIPAPGRPGGLWDVATWRKLGRRPGTKPAPAAERGEHWWPVATAIIVVAGLHVALPARYRVQPAWVVPVVLLVLLAVLIGGDPGRIDRQKTWLRVVTGVVIAFLTLANLVAAARLVVEILTNYLLVAAHP